MGKALSKKLYAINQDLLVIWCPACAEFHPFFINNPSPLGKQWKWNGNAESPTFTPSVRVSDLCHFTVTDGMITFHDDAKHVLAGQTVSIPDFPD